EEHDRDKYCFEHANGIVHRGPDLEIDYYRNHGYKITCPTLHYVDCCNKEFFVNRNVKKLSDEDGEYHLVGMGGGYSSVHAVSLARKIAEQKIHFHLYFVPYSLISPVVFKEYQKLNKTEKYFHLEKAVPFDKVPKEIAKHDFGTLIVPPEILNKYPIDALKVVISNRIFTYLESNLPIILNKRIEYMKKFIEEHNVGFSVKDEEIDNLQNIIKKYDYKELQNNVLKAREKLLINNYAERLVKFFDTITK
ncbi:MAG: hypothetical protein L6408_09625, partial [Nanoarchaeota archaeon]|nr:hypothetical protein [Nanoarchaeota archaeon]